MRVHYGFNNLPTISAPIVAVGSFDGVHLGHRLLIDRLSDMADDRGGQSVIITFDPHPRQLLRGENRLLTTLDEKLTLLSQTPVDNVIVVNFTKQFSQISHHQFIEEYIIGRLHTAMLLTGENHNFGHNKQGDAKTFEQYGIENFCLPRYDNISSTQIRELIQSGKISKATALLGSHGYLVNSPISDKSKLLPPDGRYLVEISEEIIETQIDEMSVAKISKNMLIISEL